MTAGVQTDPDDPVAVLAPDGSPRPGESVDEDGALLLRMYRWMVFGRHFDARLFSLQRQGHLTTYAPVVGQEAVQIGCALALRDEDWLVPTYRDGLACAIHGLPPEQVVLFFRGHPGAGRTPTGVNVLPLQIGIAEQIPHAVGIAWGMKLRRASSATLCLFGDGATSEGAFHEGANFAGVLHAPVVLLCQNNGWAISMPRRRQTASATISAKAAAYGMPGLRVDGNDVVAVYRATRAALERARSDEGPTMIEAVTYRVGPHTTSDDPTRYAPPEELEEWKSVRDPITRLRTYLNRVGLWDETQQDALDEEVHERVARHVAAALAEPIPSPESIFDHVYASAPPPLQAQRAEFLSGRQDHGEEHPRA